MKFVKHFILAIILSYESNYLISQTAMFDGDVNLSCTMTFISSVGSFAFTTLWVYFLGAPMVGRSVPIPYLQLTTSLAFFVLPLLLGILIQYKLTKVSDKLKKLSRPFFFVCLIIFPVVGTVQNIHFFYLCGWEHVVAGAGLGTVNCVVVYLLDNTTDIQHYIVLYFKSPENLITENHQYFRNAWLHSRCPAGRSVETRKTTSKSKQFLT